MGAVFTGEGDAGARCDRDCVGFVWGFIAASHIFPRLGEVLLQGFQEFSAFFRRECEIRDEKLIKTNFSGL